MDGMNTDNTSRQFVALTNTPIVPKPENNIRHSVQALAKQRTRPMLGNGNTPACGPSSAQPSADAAAVHDHHQSEHFGSAPPRPSPPPSWKRRVDCSSSAGLLSGIALLLNRLPRTATDWQKQGEGSVDPHPIPSGCLVRMATRLAAGHGVTWPGSRHPSSMPCG